MSTRRHGDGDLGIPARRVGIYATIAASLEVSDGTASSQNVFTWADHTIADQQYVVKVDPNIKTDVTAIIGCAVMTGAGAVINTANVQANESVAIFGVGGVGCPPWSVRGWQVRTQSLP